MTSELEEYLSNVVGDDWRPVIRWLWTEWQRDLRRRDPRGPQPDEDQWRVVLAAFFDETRDSAGSEETHR